MSSSRPRVTDAIDAFGQALQLAVTTLTAPVRAVGPWLGRPPGQWLRRPRRSPPGEPGSTAAIPPESTAAVPPESAPGTSGAERPGRAAFHPAPREWRMMALAAVLYLLAVVAWALWAILRRVDSALQQMAVGDTRPSGGLGFTVPLSNVGEALTSSAQASVDATRAAWTTYQSQVAARTVLHSPFSIARQLVLLDVCYVVVYTLLLTGLLVVLRRVNKVAGTDAERDRRDRMLRGALGVLVLLVLVDLVEDWQLYRSLVYDAPLTSLPFGIRVGPLMSLAKWPLAAGVLIPTVFVAVVLAARQKDLRDALTSIRSVLYAVGALLLLLSVGIGAAQVDDVIRAWDFWRAATAVVACAAVSFTVAGVARHLSGQAMERVAPDTGRSAQGLLLGAAVLLILAGQALRLAGWGWGLSAAGAVLALLWLIGSLLDESPQWPQRPAGAPAGFRSRLGRLQFGAALAGLVVGAGAAALLGGVVVLSGIVGAFCALVALAAWWMWDVRRQRATDDRPAEAPAATDDCATETPPATADHPATTPAATDDRATVTPAAADHPATTPAAANDHAAGTPAAAAAGAPAGSGVIASWGDRAGRFAGGLVAAAVVATIARATALDAYVREDPAEVVRWPVAAAVAVAGVGVVVLSYRVWRAHRLRESLWFWATVVLLACGLFLLADRYAVRWPQRIGTVGIVLAGFALGVGLLAALASAVRTGPVSEYRLIPALRALRFKRFPVVPLLLVWVLVVSLVDAGGYHDVRRIKGRPATVAPTLGVAWQAYLSSVPGTGPRPVVLVAAQGGGLRAAVWTALVMECLFGPGPVRSQGECAHGTGEPVRASLAAEAGKPTPVFLASGTSGGSVGLAAWTARRADLVQDGATSGTPLVVEEALRRDFVAADVARLFLADVPHAFLGWDRADRAAMLERAWEQPWPDGRGLSRGMRETWALTHAGGWHAPVLAFNGVSVEDSCRLVTSAVDFTLPRVAGRAVTSRDDRPDDAACRGVGTTDGAAADILPTTTELIDYLCPTEDIAMSTAAHLSARFPYVSPTGRIERTACVDEDHDRDGLVRPPALSYDADGGLFDNSGASTVVDTWRALAPLAAQYERTRKTCLVPLFLQIDSSPPSSAVSSVADSRPNEVFAPLTATMNQISSRDRYAKAGAAATFQHLTSADGRPVSVAGPPVPSSWFRIALYGQPGPEPPLGWTLSGRTIDDMRSQLNATPNARQMRALAAALRPENLSCAQ